MSSEDPHRKGQDFLQIVAKAKEFTEELLKENERLRFKIASLETSGATVGSEERTKELVRRVRELEERLAEMDARYRKTEEENKEFADRYIEIEEQNNNLANLYVASYQLHSTLDYKSVARREPSPFEEPLAVIPLKIKDTVIGVITINKLLFQKTAFTTMDYELFTLLAGHAATALFSAKLYSASARKLTTLQGFLDMLKTQ